MANAKLTERQIMFCDEYLVDLVAVAAYHRAGYKAKGNAAEVNSTRLLKDPRVQARIQLRMKDRAKRTEITQDRVLQELAKIGFSDMKVYSKWSNRGVELLDSEQLTAEQTSCVSEVSQTFTESGGSIKFKLHDKLKALELIGKHLGLFKDVSINLNVNNLTDAEIERILQDG